MTYEELGINNLLYRTDEIIKREEDKNDDIYYPESTTASLSRGTSSPETPSYSISSGELTGNLIVNKGFIRSANYSAGVSGWTINDDGTVEFESGNFRGDITGATGTFSGTLTGGSLNIPDLTTASSFHVDSGGNAWWGTNVATGYATAPASILSTGAATFSSINITGGAISGTTLTIGSGNSIFKADANGIYLGNATFASAPFRVNMSGDLVASSATITGALTTAAGSSISGSYLTGAISAWNITADKLRSGSTDANSNIILDPTNSIVRLGPTTDNYITLDGANQRIRSSNYSAGVSGFTIEPALIEADNIKARGSLQGVTFSYDKISAVGGQLMVANADTLASDMTALDASTLAIKGDTTFAVNDILVIRGIATSGIQEEWMRVTAVPPIIIDSYNESNQNATVAIASNTVKYVGQSFLITSTTSLYSCKFYLMKTGTPTGAITAYLYAHTGTYGVDGTPAGSPLATSSTIDAGTLTGSYALYEFLFTDIITLSASTNYCIVVSFAGGGESDYVRVGWDASSPTHGGNYFSSTDGSSWSYEAAADICFYIYTGDYSLTRDLAGSFAADSNPIWKAGIPIVKQGSSDGSAAYSGGWLRLIGEGTNSPYYSVFTRNGVAYNAYEETIRIGNLNGIGGETTDKFGFFAGTSTDYFSFNGENIVIETTKVDAITIGYGSNILFKEGGNIKFTSVTAPTACTAALAGAGAGNVDNGTHSYKITFVNATGETELGTASNTVTVADKTSDGQISLTSIPINSSSSVISRKIYRTAAGGSDYYLLDTIADNTTTTYTDNLADTSLDPVIASDRNNDTFGKVLVDGTESLSLGLNTFVGQNAGVANTVGWNNTFVGVNAGDVNTSGIYGTALGAGALGGNTTGSYNTAIGATSLVNVAGSRGKQNTALGAQSGYGLTSGGGNVFLGFAAGYYETGSNKLFVDNTYRANEADARTKALIYGIFDASTANQKLTINGLLNQSVSKTPASAAATGTTGDICWDSSYIYICTATDTWKRVEIATW